MEHSSYSPAFPVPDAESVLEHADWLRSLARRLVADEAEAEDVAQGALEALAKAGDRVRRPRTYLAGAVRHLAAKARRGEERRRRREELYALRTSEPAPSAASVAERIDTLRVVMEELRGLSDAQQQAIALRHLDGLTPKEIGKRLDLPPATVRSHLARGLARLRDRLDARFGGREAWSAVLIPWATLPAPPGPSGGTSAHPTGPASTGASVLSPTAALTSAGAIIVLTKALALTALPLAAAVLWMRSGADPDAASAARLLDQAGDASLAATTPSPSDRSGTTLGRVDSGPGERSALSGAPLTPRDQDASTMSTAGRVVDRLTGEAVPDFVVRLSTSQDLGPGAKSEIVTAGDGTFQLSPDLDLRGDWDLFGGDRHRDVDPKDPLGQLDPSDLGAVAVSVGPTFRLDLLGVEPSEVSKLEAYMSGPALELGSLLSTRVRPGEGKGALPWVRLPQTVLVTTARARAIGPWELHVISLDGLAEGRAEVRRASGIEAEPVTVQMEPRGALDFLLPAENLSPWTLHTIDVESKDGVVAKRVQCLSNEHAEWASGVEISTGVGIHWPGTLELLSPGSYRWSYGLGPTAQVGIVEVQAGHRTEVRLRAPVEADLFEAHVRIDASLAPDADLSLWDFSIAPEEDPRQSFQVGPRRDPSGAASQWLITATGLARGAWTLHSEFPDQFVVEPSRIILDPGAPERVMVAQRLAPPVKIGLRVIDADTQEPVQGAYAFHMLGGEWAVLRGDAQGHLPPHAVPAERETGFLVRAPGYEAQRATVPAWTPEGSMTIPMKPGWGSRVWIQNIATGEGLAGVRVKVDGVELGATDALGELWFNGDEPPGEIEIDFDDAVWELTGEPRMGDGSLFDDPPPGYIFSLRPRR